MNPSLAETYLTFGEGERILEGKVCLVQNDFYFSKIKEKLKDLQRLHVLEEIVQGGVGMVLHSAPTFPHPWSPQHSNVGYT